MVSGIEKCPTASETEKEGAYLLEEKQEKKLSKRLGLIIHS